MEEDKNDTLELQQSETGHSPETSKERILSKPTILGQQSSGQQSAVNIVDRCLTWAKQRQQKLEKAQEEHKRRQQETSECTFKPDLAKSKTLQPPLSSQVTTSEFQAAIQEENQKKGFDKYLQRMDKAKQNRIDKEKLEDQLFHREKQWKAKITQPVEPKLSAFINKKERDVQVKALNKPVDIHENNTSVVIAKNYASQRQEDVRIETGQGIKYTQDFIKITQQNKDKYVEIKGDMTYDEAVTLIHQHILDLEF